MLAPARGPTPKIAGRRREAIGNTVALRAEVGETSLSINELADLALDDVLVLDQHLAEPVSLVRRKSGTAVGRGQSRPCGRAPRGQGRRTSTQTELEEEAMTSKVVNSIDLPILHAGGSNAQSRVGERLDLIEHVKVRVRCRWVKPRSRSRRLFALGGGDVLALDRDADAPVDIRVERPASLRAACSWPSATSFGVRITEIESR